MWGKHRRLLNLLGFSSVMAIASMAQAQTAPTAAAAASATPPGDDGHLQEIVVTGQKRAGTVDVQRVSTAVTALDGRMLERSIITDIGSIGRLAPNVQLNSAATFSNYANFYIRGLGVNLSVRTVDQAVGLFMDGVYIGYSPESLPDTFDLGSVEIFRGPQGTLFGKNVTGGAVSLERARPTGKFEGYADVILGDYNRREFGGVLNLPIVGDKLDFRIAALKKNRDGYWTNGVTGKSVDRVNTVSVRPSLRWRPDPAIDIVLRGEYVADHGGSAAIENKDTHDSPRNVGATYTPTLATAQALFGYIPPSDPYVINHDLRGYVDGKVWGATVNATFDLGHGVVTAVGGYRHVNYNSSTDFDGSPLVLFEFPDNREHQEQKSGELRYASKFSRIIEFTAGLYYFTQKYFIGERRQFFSGGTAAAPIITKQAGLTEEKDQSYAAFFQGRLKLLDNVWFVGGARYSHETKNITVCPYNTPSFSDIALSHCTVQYLYGKLTASGVTPKFGVDWQVNDHVFAYASATKGLKSGAFNSRATNTPSLGPAKDESVWSYETGLKTELFDRHLRVNGAFYYTDYNNVQRPIQATLLVNGVPLTANFVQNAAQARIWGAELEVNAIPVRGLSIDGSLGYTNARFRKFTGIDADRNGTYVPAVDDPLATGLRFERVPAWQSTVAVGYETSIGYGSVSSRLSYSWRSSQFSDGINTPVMKIKAYGLLDANIGWSSPGDRYRVSLFGRNLGNVYYWDYGFDGGAYRFVAGGAPRTFGAELRARF